MSWVVVGDNSSGIGPARSIISKDVKQEIINSGKNILSFWKSRMFKFVGIFSPF